MIGRRSTSRRIAPVVALLAALAFAPIGGALAKQVVVIDAGHGGSDNGAKWGGVAEKDLALDLAKRVAAMLKRKNIPTVMTRTTDKTLSLDERVAIANKYDDALFISLHFNASRNTSIRGIETYYMSRAGRALASLIQGRLGKRIRTRNRGIKRRTGFAVLHKTEGVAVLVECGFISNPWERKRCNASWLRNILAEEIAAAIITYYRR